MAQRGAYMGSGHDENLCLEIINALIDQYKATLAPPPPVPAPSAMPLLLLWCRLHHRLRFPGAGSDRAGSVTALGASASAGRSLNASSPLGLLIRSAN
jgi:hypothetical protein